MGKSSFTRDDRYFIASFQLVLPLVKPGKATWRLRHSSVVITRGDRRAPWQKTKHLKSSQGFLTT